MSPATEIAEAAQRMFGGVPRVFRAPGRVNLIGEHTDYNDGFVLPAAIGLSTLVARVARTDRKLVVYSENCAELREFDLDAAPERGCGHWSDYAIGVAVTLQRAGIQPGGANLFIRSEVPIGAGLSSSAALEVAVALALLTDASSAAGMGAVDLAPLCRRAENEFVGVQCGIMDQFVAVHAAEGRALLLDCRSLEYRHVRLPREAALVIANTLVRHNLAAGEYNRRRAECEEAAAFFGESLRDVAIDEVERADGRLPGVIFRRARHVVTENARVLQAEDALNGGDLRRFGELMGASHRSLRDDYQVSCPELDALVEAAGDLQGCYGARMTGGGFGGCTVNLVAAGEADAFGQALLHRYRERTGMDGQVYVSAAGSGAVEIVNL